MNFYHPLNTFYLVKIY